MVSHVWLSATTQTITCQAPVCSWNFPGKNTRMGCHFLLQGILPTQEQNSSLSCLLHWQAGSLPLSHPGSLSFVKWNIINWWRNFAYNDMLWSFFHVIKYTFKTKWNNVCIECWQNVETGWQIHRDTKAKHRRIDASDLESPLDCKEDQTSQSQRKSTLNIHWKDWCWSWSSDTLATWCEQPTHCKRPWCWERLKAKGEGDDRGWDGWMASPTQWTWVWANSGRQWRTGKPGVLQSTGLQRAGHDLATGQQLPF